MTRPLRVAALDPNANRLAFSCGVAALDHYFHTQVGQDIRRRVTACFVATAPDGAIAGYYTLASASIQLADLPITLSKKLPRYPSVPAIRMGRLAVSEAFKGTGLGGALLADALARAARAEIAAYAFVVDAKNETAAEFYAHHGFVALPDRPLMLMMALGTVKGLVVG